MTTRLRGRAAALDYAQLTAALTTRQSASATGSAATLLATAARVAPARLPEALAILFAAAPGWAAAVGALGGRFHPDVTTTALPRGRQQT